MSCCLDVRLTIDTGTRTSCPFCKDILKIGIGYSNGFVCSFLMFMAALSMFTEIKGEIDDYYYCLLPSVHYKRRRQKMYVSLRIEPTSNMNKQASNPSKIWQVSMRRSQQSAGYSPNVWTKILHKLARVYEPHSCLLDLDICYTWKQGA
jgi:hypothetical protein